MINNLQSVGNFRDDLGYLFVFCVYIIVFCWPGRADLLEASGALLGSFVGVWGGFRLFLLSDFHVVA